MGKLRETGRFNDFPGACSSHKTSSTIALTTFGLCYLPLECRAITHVPSVHSNQSPSVEPQTHHQTGTLSRSKHARRLPRAIPRRNRCHGLNRPRQTAAVMATRALGRRLLRAPHLGLRWSTASFTSRLRHGSPTASKGRGPAQSPAEGGFTVLVAHRFRPGISCPNTTNRGQTRVD